MMRSIPHHYLDGFVAQAVDQRTVCPFHLIEFQLQIDVYCRCGRSQVEGYPEVVPHEPFCVRKRLLHAQSRLCQFHLCLVLLCFQREVAFRMQVDYR